MCALGGPRSTLRTCRAYGIGVGDAGSRLYARSPWGALHILPSDP